MTLTHTQKKVKPGMTLLELTVVILVLLSLISVLFVGARAWRRGSDRATNIMNLRNIQQAVRSEQNTRNLADGAGLANTLIFSQDADGTPGSTATQNYLAEPRLPGSGTASDGTSASAYTYGTTVPNLGTLYVTGPSSHTPYPAEGAANAYGLPDSEVSEW